MKFAIIAAALMASSAASAIALPEANLYFTAEQAPSCSISVVDDHAPIFFTYNDSVNIDNYASVAVNADFVKHVNIASQGTWTDTSAWNGVEPTTQLHIMTEGDFGNTSDTVQNVNYQGRLDGNRQAGQQGVFFMGVEANEMTHAGTARFDAVVQFDCEWTDTPVIDSELESMVCN